MVMIIVVGVARVSPARREEAFALMRRMEDASRQENGCLLYHYSELIGTPNTFELYQEWESDDALTAHFRTAHMREFQTVIHGLLDKEFTIERYDRIEVASVEPL